LIRKILFTAVLLSLFQLNGEPIGVTGYLPSYRLESSVGAMGSSVVDLTGYTPDYSSYRRIHQQNLPYSPTSFPASYHFETIESWYGENLDTLIYFSLSPGTDGSVDWTSADKRDLQRLNNIRHIYDTNLMLAISGKSEDFIPLISEDEKREAFIEEALSFCRDNNFSGIDLDWEFPRNEAELSTLTLLITDLKKAFSPYAYSVSAAVSRFRPLDEKMLAALDRIHLMAYDNYGRHSTYESAVEACE
jgi:hypothetical protein